MSNIGCQTLTLSSVGTIIADSFTAHGIANSQENNTIIDGWRYRVALEVVDLKSASDAALFDDC